MVDVAPVGNLARGMKCGGGRSHLFLALVTYIFTTYPFRDGKSGAEGGGEQDSSFADVRITRELVCLSGGAVQVWGRTPMYRWVRPEKYDEKIVEALHLVSTC